MKKTAQFQTFTLTLLALIAFAANSVLCRMALGQQQVDASSFALLRLVSGAITMIVILQLLRPYQASSDDRLTDLTTLKTWLAPFMLFGYAWCFSFAYIALNTATGALILFATVQFTMLGYGLYKGSKQTLWQWFGIILAVAGFVYLMLPNATRPELTGFTWMFLAGLCWAVYSLAGKTSKNAITATGHNFILSVPMVIVASLLSLVFIEFDWQAVTTQGVVLACLSGSLASACGYTLWYLALKNISITLAAICQLSVPVIAAVGGIAFMNESMTDSFMLAAAMILVGITIVTLKNAK